MYKDATGDPRARLAAPNPSEPADALNIFPTEDALKEALFERPPVLEPVGSTVDDVCSRPGEEHSAVVDDGVAGKSAKPGWLVSWIVIALIVVAIPAALVLTIVAVAMPFGLGWLVYAGLIQPVMRTEAAVIVLNPLPRLMIFAAWLSMMSVGAIALIRGWDAVRGRIGFVRTDSVMWAVVTSVSSALIAFGLTSWVVRWLLAFLR